MSDLPGGATAYFSVRGHRLTLFGTADAGGVVEVGVDDQTVGTIAGVSGAEGAVLFEVDGLPDAWHTVTLRGVESGVSFDYAEARGEDVTLEVLSEPAPASVPEGCGCGVVPGRAAPWIVAVVIAGGRRRGGVRRG